MPDASPHPEAYCLSCGYRLDTFADPPRCPECGGGFDPDDPYSVRAPGFKSAPKVNHWVNLIAMMAAIAIVMAMLIVSGIDLAMRTAN